jgi:hypothetical protein
MLNILAKKRQKQSPQNMRFVKNQRDMDTISDQSEDAVGKYLSVITRLLEKEEKKNEYGVKPSLLS